MDTDATAAHPTTRPSDLYLWQYPAQDLFPLALRAIVLAGTQAGTVAARRPLANHWPSDAVESVLRSPMQRHRAHH